MYTLKFAAIAACLEVAAFLVCLASQNGAANQRSPAQPAQSQDVAQQTNGRGAIGANCKPEGNGCRVGRLIKDGPAKRAGLRVGDRFLRLNPTDQAGAVEQIAKNAPATKIMISPEPSN